MNIISEEKKNRIFEKLNTPPAKDKYIFVSFARDYMDRKLITINTRCKYSDVKSLLIFSEKFEEYTSDGFDFGKVLKDIMNYKAKTKIKNIRFSCAFIAKYQIVASRIHRIITERI